MQIPPNGIIGNTPYRDIRDRHYETMKTERALPVAERLLTEGIAFSGRVNQITGKTTLTVNAADRERIKDIVERIHGQPKAYVTKEQIARAREISIEEYLRTYEAHNITEKSGEIRVKGYGGLVASNGKWNWFNEGIGGKTALSFLEKVRGMSFVEAVKYLVSEEQMYQSYALNPPPAEKKRFELPARGQNSRRAMAYLFSRHIGKEIIYDCIKQKIIYESEQHHNCVFVGRDLQGVARYAAMRGTLSESSFKQEVSSSDKRFNFCYGDKTSGTVFVTESAIDALSVATWVATIDEKWKSHAYLSSAGVSSKSLNQYLADHSETTSVMLAFDNDAAGMEAMTKIAAELKDTFKGEVSLFPPPYGKDYNEALPRLLIDAAIGTPEMEAER